ncbi:MAG: EamA family transporter [Candidatus Absconditabacterales bacterium]|nr:EamA family transporter [Candidatus Absconditabacterales bacterium]
MINYLYIFGTIFFTVYGQLVLKWRIIKYGVMPEVLIEKIFFLLKLFFDPFILSGFISAFLASLCWMAAMTKFNLSYAYPFMSLSFVLVFIFSVFLFKEPTNLIKLAGLFFIVLGVILSGVSRGGCE